MGKKKTAARAPEETVKETSKDKKAKSGPVQGLSNQDLHAREREFSSRRNDVLLELQGIRSTPDMGTLGSNERHKALINKLRKVELQLSEVLHEITRREKKKQDPNAASSATVNPLPTTGGWSLQRLPGMPRTQVTGPQ
eukprot:gnl/TRDRNA2_/TRDRNA2_164211_c2_seq1.p1 gnl/TRDRNA2_/TRDRNA2_164211_c2~~gnl/TRDRNA2_/TRDRNA2_164211_c2_seq1.p1  ORF type:complete len:139 (-),score=18.86 gnl/TRDRNA2_/TRDRNA2_164211_c2_seq1:77-493(-)